MAVNPTEPPAKRWFRYSAHCLFCGKNQSNNSRTGRTWKCRSCGEINIGPGLKKIQARLLTAAEPAKATRTKVSRAAPPPPSAPVVTTSASTNAGTIDVRLATPRKAAKTRIGPSAPAAPRRAPKARKVTAKAAPKGPKPAPQKPAPAAPPRPPARPGFFDRALGYV